MITLTRFSGSVFALNSDLIERVDATPDTVITLVDGTKYVVAEPLDEVVAAIRAYRGAVIAESARLSAVPDLPPAQPGLQTGTHAQPHTRHSGAHPSQAPRRLAPVPDPSTTPEED
jgi:flagellar protein FlbD